MILLRIPLCTEVTRRARTVLCERARSAGGWKTTRRIYRVLRPDHREEQEIQVLEAGGHGGTCPPPDFMERGHRGAQGSTGGVYITYTERQIIIRTRMRTDGVNSKCYIAIMGMVTQILVARFTCCYECPPQYKTSSVTYDM